jgi:hypothetical protein
MRAEITRFSGLVARRGGHREHEDTKIKTAVVLCVFVAESPCSSWRGGCGSARESRQPFERIDALGPVDVRPRHGAVQGVDRAIVRRPVDGKRYPNAELMLQTANPFLQGARDGRRHTAGMPVEAEQTAKRACEEIECVGRALSGPPGEPDRVRPTIDDSSQGPKAWNQNGSERRRSSSAGPWSATMWTDISRASRVMRAKSHAGARPEWSGRLAKPVCRDMESAATATFLRNGAKPFRQTL